MDKSLITLEDKLSQTAMETLQAENRQLVAEVDFMKEQLCRAMGHVLLRVDDIKDVGAQVEDAKQELKDVVADMKEEMLQEFRRQIDGLAREKAQVVSTGGNKSSDELKEFVVKEIKTQLSSDIRLLRHEMKEAIKTSQKEVAKDGAKSGEVSSGLSVEASSTSVESSGQEMRSFVQEIKSQVSNDLKVMKKEIREGIKSSGSDVGKKYDLLSEQLQVVKEDQNKNLVIIRDDIIKSGKKNAKDIKSKMDLLKGQAQSTKEEPDVNASEGKLDRQGSTDTLLSLDESNYLSKDVLDALKSYQEENSMKLDTLAADIQSLRDEQESRVIGAIEDVSLSLKLSSTDLKTKLEDLTGKVNSIKEDFDKNSSVIKDEISMVVDKSDKETRKKLDTLKDHLVSKVRELVIRQNRDVKQPATRSSRSYMAAPDTGDLSEKIDALSLQIQGLANETEEQISSTREEILILVDTSTKGIRAKLDKIMSEIVHQQSETESLISVVKDRNDSGKDTQEAKDGKDVTPSLDAIKFKLNTLTSEVRDMQSETENYITMIKDELLDSMDHSLSDIAVKMDMFRSDVSEELKFDTQEHTASMKYEITEALVTSQEDIKVQLEVMSGQVEDLKQNTEAAVRKAQKEEVIKPKDEPEDKLVCKYDRNEMMDAINKFQEDVTIKLDSIKSEIAMESEKQKTNTGHSDMSPVTEMLRSLQTEIISDIVTETRKQRGLSKEELSQELEKSIHKITSKLDSFKTDFADRIESSTGEQITLAKEELQKAQTNSTWNIKEKIESILEEIISTTQEMKDLKTSQDAGAGRDTPSSRPSDVTMRSVSYEYNSQTRDSEKTQHLDTFMNRSQSDDYDAHGAGFFPGQTQSLESFKPSMATRTHLERVGVSVGYPSAQSVPTPSPGGKVSQGIPVATGKKGSETGKKEKQSKATKSKITYRL